MKTAIITFQDAANYGAALQAFALKTVMTQWVDTDIINYYNETFHRSHAPAGLKSKVLHLLNGRIYQRKSERFQRFQKQYLVGENEILHDDSLACLNDRYDLFITGSDQVWNLECSGHKTAYFLDFVTDNRKKYSYAASFGGTTVKDEPLVQSLLSSFNQITVRESSGKKLIQQMLGREVPVVVDPTLLMDKDQWRKCFNLNFQEKYVLVYEVLRGENLISAAQKYGREHNLPVICITSSDRPRPGVKCIKDAGPEQWLDLFAGSAYVFTNSFHGLAFSLIFEKQFSIELLPPPATTNARLLDLLTNVALEDRVMENGQYRTTSIEYDAVHSRMDALRAGSLRYIHDMVSGGNPEIE